MRAETWDALAAEAARLRDPAALIWLGISCGTLAAHEDAVKRPIAAQSWRERGTLARRQAESIRAAQRGQA